MATTAPPVDTAAVPEQAVVDDTSISPTRTTSRDTLEKRLAQRPDAQDLKNRGILMDTNAAP
jgi:RPEL repeat